MRTPVWTATVSYKLVHFASTNLVVLCVVLVEGSMNAGFNRIKAVQDLLGLVEILSRTLQILQLQLDISNRNGCVDIGVLRIGVVDFLRHGLQEGKALLAVCMVLAIAIAIAASSQVQLQIPRHCEAASRASSTSFSWLILSAKVRINVL